MISFVLFSVVLKMGAQFWLGGHSPEQPNVRPRLSLGLYSRVTSMVDEYDALGAHPSLQALPVRAPPAPWKPFVRRDEYLLTHFAFAENCTHCQIVSINGISVLAIPSLELVHNEPERNLSIALPDLVMDGVGPLTGQRLRFAGRDGGGFSYRSSDGWRCEPIFMRTALEAVFLQPPNSDPESIADVLTYEYNKVVEDRFPQIGRQAFGGRFARQAVPVHAVHRIHSCG